MSYLYFLHFISPRAKMGRDSNACPGCKTNVVNLDIATRCSVCDTPYHQSCSVRQSRLENAAFAKCCGPPSRATSPNPPTSQQPKDDILVALEKMGDGIREEINKFL